MITIPYQALKYEGTAAGVPQTTMQIWDSEVPAGSGTFMAGRSESDDKSSAATEEPRLARAG
jgi:hypothetical protein